MSQNQDPESNKIQWEDIPYTNMIQIEALARILVEKGIISELEINDKISQVHQEFIDSQEE